MVKSSFKFYANNCLLRITEKSDVSSANNVGFETKFSGKSFMYIKKNNKDTKMMSLTLLWCLHHQLRPYPTPYSNAPISDPEKTTVYWTMIISRENTLRVKPAEPNKHSYMYHKRNIVGSQWIQIIISIIKNHYFICRSIQANKRALNPPVFFLNI